MGERPKTKSLSQVFVLILLSKVVLKSKSCNLLYVNELFRTTFDNLIVLITNEVLEESTSDMPEKTIVPQKRISSKQRRLSLDEYRTTYLHVPKIADRKPVFVSGEVRDSLDRIVRYFGGRGMSASGMVENLVRLHLKTYREDIEQWRKL